jgi:hypothetical protein
MVHPVEAFPDITLDNPEILVLGLDAAVAEVDTVHRPASGSEAVRAIQEITFPDWLHEHPQ